MDATLLLGDNPLHSLVFLNPLLSPHGPAVSLARVLQPYTQLHHVTQDLCLHLTRRDGREEVLVLELKEVQGGKEFVVREKREVPAG